jgi:hypothetical protein
MKKLFLFGAALLCASCSNESPFSATTGAMSEENAVISTNSTFECLIDGQIISCENGVIRHSLQRSEEQVMVRIVCHDPDGVDNFYWDDHLCAEFPTRFWLSSVEKDTVESIVELMTFDTVGTTMIKRTAVDRHGEEAVVSLVVTVNDSQQ